MLRRIIGHIKGIKRKIMMFLFMHNFFYKIKCVPEKNWENSLSALQEFTDRFQNLMVKDILHTEIKDYREGKYVGGVLINETTACCIPNSSRQIILFNTDTLEYKKWGLLSEEKFKWSGGGQKGPYVFAFPRACNKVLRIDCQKLEAEEIDISINYKGEHHYGGVLCKNGIIYQPPRNTNHLLAINTVSWQVHKIKLLHGFYNKLRYCASVVHPNGYVYFLPERNERVIMFYPPTEKFVFIGKFLSECMVFHAVVSVDGNIYGFSLYKGILKIDVRKNYVEMLYMETYFGCYGTKLGINGKIYGIVGDGEIFWEYDVVKCELKKVAVINDRQKAKCAGGFTDREGNIHMIPTFGDKIYTLNFNNKEKIPEILYKQYFSDNY